MKGAYQFIVESVNNGNIREICHQYIVRKLLKIMHD